MVASQILLNEYWILKKSMDIVLFRTDIHTKLYLCTNFQKKHNDGVPNLLWIFKVHISLNNGSEPDFAEWVLDANKIDGYSAIKDIYRYKIVHLHQFPEKAQRWSPKSFMNFQRSYKA